VRLPGEIEMENLARHVRDGLEIDAALLRTLEGFAARPAARA
jgi:LDH2 family malate/lactate/ureidoglycolate dehydrogenase